jgi:glutaminyl-peptide cyclotransferase
MDRASTIDSAYWGIGRFVRATVFGLALTWMSVASAAQETPANPLRNLSPLVEIEAAQVEAAPNTPVQHEPVQHEPAQIEPVQKSASQGEVPASPVSAVVEPKSTRQSGETLTNAGAVASRFDRNAAFGYLKEICEIGPRPSASPGMRKQQTYLQQHFERIGGKFFSQAFSVRSPYNGQWVQLHNIVVQWHPQRTKRLMICCHHDTRPFADSDPQNPRARFIGANDGGSGVALLCELGKHIAALGGDYGVDFVFFDGEEFVIQRQRDPMFLGSTYFAQQYTQGNVGWKYEQAVLVDMVADKDLQIFLEGNSMHFAKGLTQDVWSVARAMGVHEFIPEQKQFIRDDHLPLNEIAKIPTCDIIDFDFPNPTQGNIYWHTREDNLGNCSAESLGKVGSVVLGWIRFKQNQK